MCNCLHNKGLKQKFQEILVTSVSLLVTKLHFSLAMPQKYFYLRFDGAKIVFYFVFIVKL